MKIAAFLMLCCRIVRWTIRVCVKSKEPIRHWNNTRLDKQGDVFSMWLADNTEEMKCSAFNEEVHKFYELMEVGQVGGRGFSPYFANLWFVRYGRTKEGCRFCLLAVVLHQERSHQTSRQSQVFARESL